MKKRIRKLKKWRKTLDYKFTVEKSNGKNQSVDIHYADQIICLVERNKEIENFDIVFFPYKNKKAPTIFLMKGFLEALNNAKNLLLE